MRSDGWLPGKKRVSLQCCKADRGSLDLTAYPHGTVETLAAAEGLTIEFIKKVKAFRKEDRVQQILATRGPQPGLADERPAATDPPLPAGSGASRSPVGRAAGRAKIRGTR